MRALLAIIAWLLAVEVWAQSPITTARLIDEMISLDSLTRFPVPRYKMIQFSSYDRRSVRSGEENWFANSDGSGVESVIKPADGSTPGEYLLGEVHGPGAIVRTWTADISGTIQVYLDGSEKPVYDGPAMEFLRHPYDSYLAGSGIARKLLDGAFYQRDAAYAPIPFAEGCRIVWIGNEKDVHFYHVQMRTYPADTPVTTFTAGDVAANAERIQNVARILASPSKYWTYHSAEAPLAMAVDLPAGVISDGLSLEGGGAIERLTLKVEANQLDLALRQTVLRIQFDGHPWGQIEAPLGDFFGAGPGIVPYDSLPFTVAPDGTMTCRYPMPFASTMRLTFENRGSQPVRVTGTALRATYAWDNATSMHLRARWRANHDLVASNRANVGAQDLPFVAVRGQGVYVGTAITLLNPSPIPTTWGSWWGEGDEKIFVDDDSFPSIFGTGSEDYFNYSWSSPDLFAYAYCGQPRDDGPANRGFVVNQRWHILDPLPFQENLAFYMELASHDRTEGVSYARLSYLYARPGAADDHVRLQTSDLRIPTLPETWEPASRIGSARLSFQACENLISERARTSIVEGPLWQGGRVVVWKPQKDGGKLDISFEIEEAADYTLTLACMLTSDAGSFTADVDGKAVKFDGKDTVQLAIDWGIQSRMYGAGVEGLSRGRHTLTLTSVSSDRPIGIDFLGLASRKK